MDFCVLYITIRGPLLVRWFGLLGFNASPTARVIYQGGEMMTKSVFWWRKPEYPEETTDLRQVTDEYEGILGTRPATVFTFLSNVPFDTIVIFG